MLVGYMRVSKADGSQAPIVNGTHSLPPELKPRSSTKTMPRGKRMTGRRAAMGHKETHVGKLCTELGISRQTLYRHVSPTGELRADGSKLLTNPDK